MKISVQHVICSSWATSSRNVCACGFEWQGGDADGCGCERVVLRAESLLGGAQQSRHRHVPPPCDTILRGHGAHFLCTCCQGGQVI